MENIIEWIYANSDALLYVGSFLLMRVLPNSISDKVIMVLQFMISNRRDKEGK